MPTCHKCPHHADVQAGRYADVEFSKVPCFSCRFTGDSTNNGGKSFSSIDSDNAGIGAELAAASLKAKPEAPLPELPAGMLDFFRAWLDLPARGRECFAWRCLHPGEELKVLAGELGISTQAVHHAVVSAENALRKATGARLLLPHCRTFAARNARGG